jgi:hypothetical protein
MEKTFDNFNRFLDKMNYISLDNDDVIYQKQEMNELSKAVYGEGAIVLVPLTQENFDKEWERFEEEEKQEDYQTFKNNLSQYLQDEGYFLVSDDDSYRWVQINEVVKQDENIDIIHINYETECSKCKWKQLKVDREFWYNFIIYLIKQKYDNNI